MISGAAIVVGAGYFAYKRAKDNFDFSFNGAHINNADNDTVNLTLQFVVKNETGYAFTILSNAYNIYFNGQILGVAVQNEPVSVPNNTIVNVYANLVLSTSQISSSLVSVIWDKLFNGSGGMDLAVQGKCKIRIDAAVLSIATITVPVDERFSI